MVMGKTSTVNITHQMMQDILSAVSEYRTRTNSLAEELDSVVNGLIPGQFDGAAADGFKYFYLNNIVPANGEGLKDLLDTIEQMANGILESIPGGSGLDDQLGDGNKQ